MFAICFTYYVYLSSHRLTNCLEQPLKRCKRHNKPLIIDPPWEDKPDGELQIFSVGVTKPFTPAQIGTPILHLWISFFFSSSRAMRDIFRTASYNTSHSFFRSFA